jgi:excisionase family DNA binding protein
MMKPDETYISTSEAALALGISRQRVLQLIRGERLKATKFANVFMIRRTDLAAVEDRPQGRPPAPKPEQNGKKRGKK